MISPDTVLATAGLIVAFVAMVRAERKLKIAQDTINNANTTIKEAHAELGKIKQALPTHFIGQFPDYMGNIIELIDSSTKRLHVLCDLPAYGQFSNPHASRQYRQALENAASRIPVSFMCLSEGARRINNEQQFGNDWKKLYADEKFKADLAQFNKQHKVTISDLPPFMDELLKRHTKCLEDWVPFHEVLEVEALLPVHLWIADETKAVFSFCSFGKDTPLTEFAFETTDSGLIKAFDATWQRYHHIAKPFTRAAKV